MNAGYRGENHTFSMVPKAEIQRSTFDRSHGHKTTFDEGQLIPILVDEVLPGDTHSLNLTAFARLATPIKPIMDSLYMDFFFFFVPNRLLWTNWQRFCGEQDNPGDSISFVMPRITSPITVSEKSLGDYFGLPLVGSTNMNVTALPFRAYNRIYNEWFRDQNLINSAVLNLGDGPDLMSDYTVRRRAKRHDYFTSALPQPQKGATPVSLPLGTRANVKGLGVINATANASGAQYWETGGSGPASDRYWSTGVVVKDVITAAGSAGTGGHFPDVYADLSTATAATINALRQAFQIQRLLERDARGGTRYVEILKAHFGVQSPDARLQRSEYLGGGSLPIQVNPVAQTSPLPSTGTLTPQGNLSAFATAGGGSIGFTKSFVEHGYIIGIACVRPEVSYQRGLHRMWSRYTRYDFYWPAFANLGEQGILNKELYVDGSGVDDTVFGYVERWAEYRYFPSKITGQFRSQAATPLDMWHLAEKFTTRPALNQTFIEYPSGSTAPLYRCLAVPTEPHILFDAWFRYKSTRPMPVYSVPGMMDHF